MSRSIAQYTGTRIDSSARHILQCRVNHNLYMKLGHNEQELVQDKFRFAMMKDEIVLNVNSTTSQDRPNENADEDFFEETYTKHPYPAVITTLGTKLTDEMKEGIAEHYRNMTDAGDIYNIRYKHNDEMKVFPYRFFVQGVSLGTAYASDLSGDNVGSVMIGGMHTVLNGHFPCYTGEFVQWYFDFEKNEYDEEGYRNQLADSDRSDYENGKRERFHRQRMFADYKETNKGKQNMAFIKSYRPIRHSQKIGDYLMGDTTRVFGKVVNGGQPWEPIDIFICNVFL